MVWILRFLIQILVVAVFPKRCHRVIGEDIEDGKSVIDEKAERSAIHPRTIVPPRRQSGLGDYGGNAPGLTGSGFMFLLLCPPQVL